MTLYDFSVNHDFHNFSYGKKHVVKAFQECHSLTLLCAKKILLCANKIVGLDDSVALMKSFNSTEFVKSDENAPNRLILCPHTWFFTADRLERVSKSCGLKIYMFERKNWEYDFNCILKVH